MADKTTITKPKGEMNSEDKPEYGDLITEGQAKVYLPGNVFYNPVQEFNRDLTIAAINEYGRITKEERKAKLKNKEKNVKDYLDEQQPGDDCDEVQVSGSSYTSDKHQAGEVCPDGLMILEGLAATGLRSIRFAKEVHGVKKVIANDFDRNAVKIMQENVKLNSVEHLMRTSCNDAAMVMYESSRGQQFDVIDLDPYGGPTKFLDSAVQAVRDGGLLCVTCTDMAILCGNASEKCYAAYGSMSLKSKSCHELALRIVLRTIDSYANRYAKFIEPLLSVSVDFYCRVFVRVFSGAKSVKESASKVAMVYECTGCSIHHLQPLARIVETISQNTGQIHKKFTFATGPPVDKLCEHCNKPFHVGGPLWAKPLHDPSFVKSIISRVVHQKPKYGTADRIIGMMTLILEELQDVPLYYELDQLSSVIHVTSPSFVAFRSAILHAGYRVSLSHANKISLKTDAPPEVLWDILRCWVKKHPVKESRLIEGTPCAAILSKEPKLEANFEPHKDAKPQSKKDGLLRYQTGKKDWGPKPRPQNKKDGKESGVDKRKQNQNKRACKRRRVHEQDKDMKQHYCAAFRKEGSCAYGDECKYSHVPVEHTASNKKDHTEAEQANVDSSGNGMDVTQ